MRSSIQPQLLAWFVAFIGGCTATMGDDLDGNDVETIGTVQQALIEPTLWLEVENSGTSVTASCSGDEALGAGGLAEFPYDGLNEVIYSGSGEDKVRVKAYNAVSSVFAYAVCSDAPAQQVQMLGHLSRWEDCNGRRRSLCESRWQIVQVAPQS